jgi:hypothetical protein
MQRTAFCDDLSRNLSGFQHGKLRPSIFAAIRRKNPCVSSLIIPFRAPCAPDGGWLPGAPVCRPARAASYREMPSRQAGTGFQQVFPFDQGVFCVVTLDIISVFALTRKQAEGSANFLSALTRTKEVSHGSS